MLASGMKDEGDAAILNMVLHKYVLPNANSQKKFLKKLRLWQFNSSVYGFMPMYYDWNVTDRYVGPDCWLWHPRNWVPQVGRASIDDMEYCYAITYVNRDYLEDLLEGEQEGVDAEAVQDLLDSIDQKSNIPNDKRTSYITRQRQFQPERGRLMLATRYESGEDGHWVVFAPEYGWCDPIRDYPNPHKNGKIPFVIKYSTDLFDNIYGLGDFQRAKPIQFANDGLDNFYFQSVKRNLYPPTIYNPAGVNKMSLTNDPGAFWQETIPNSIREYHTDPVGLSTYQSAKSIMNGALTFQSGSTQTDLTAASTGDPTFSRTSAGVDQQESKESTRDSQDRFELEQALEELLENMMGLFPTINTEAIPLDLFSDDIQELVDAGYGGGITQLVESKKMKVSDGGTTAKITIPASFFKDMTLRFKMSYDSTAQQDKSQKAKALTQFVASITSVQNELVEMKNQGQTLDWKLIAQLTGELTDVPQLGKIFRAMTPQEAQSWQQSQQPAPPATKDIDNTNYKDLPPWAQEQWLKRQGFQQQPGESTITPEQQLKAGELAIKTHEAGHNSIDAVAPPQEPAPAGTEAPDLTSQPLPLAVHGGQPIVDPHFAALHAKLGGMLESAK